VPEGSSGHGRYTLAVGVSDAQTIGNADTLAESHPCANCRRRDGVPDVQAIRDADARANVRSAGLYRVCALTVPARLMPASTSPRTEPVGRPVGCFAATAPVQLARAAPRRARLPRQQKTTRQARRSRALPECTCPILPRAWRFGCQRVWKGTQCIRLCGKVTAPCIGRHHPTARPVMHRFVWLHQPALTACLGCALCDSYRARHWHSGHRVPQALMPYWSVMATSS
jgi:hypothetical protein